MQFYHSKNLNQEPMKNLLKMLVIAAVLLTISCSKDDEPKTYGSVNLPLLPASFEQNNAVNITDATGGCGSNAVTTPVVSEIMISNNGIIIDPSKVTIDLGLSHTWCGDLVVELIAPSGDSCTLIKRLGSSSNEDSCASGANFISTNILSFNSLNPDPINVLNYTTDDEVPAGNYMPSSGAGTFLPSVKMTPLKGFLMNKSINGTWKLRVADYGGGDSGSIQNWKIRFEAAALF